MPGQATTKKRMGWSRAGNNDKEDRPEWVTMTNRMGRGMQH